MLSVQSNILAQNAYRQFNITTKKRAKNTEKLSSGYRINRAADDAAGLSISENMRRRIRGLRQGMDNIQEGISLCNVADGAMVQVHEMMHRMEELAIKAANATLSDEDRRAISEEIEHLKKEIDRIGNTTTFNEQRVFQGAYEALQYFQPTATGKFFELLGDNVSHTGYMEEPLDPTYLASLKNTGMNANGLNPFVSVHADFKDLVKEEGNQIEKLIGAQFYVNCCTNCCARTITFTDEVGMKTVGNELRIGIRKSEGQDGANPVYYNNAAEFCSDIVDAAMDLASHAEFACDGSKLYMYDIDANTWSEASKKLAYFCDAQQSLVTQTASDESSFRIKMSDGDSDAMTIVVGELSTKMLKIATNNCLTVDNANTLIGNLNYANKALSQMRSRIGAYENRLEHSYNVNSNTYENTTAAESQIRDADVAKLMVEYSNQNILSQAGDSMLAQANQQPNFILQLLR